MLNGLDLNKARFWLAVAGFFIMLGLQIQIIFTHISSDSVHLTAEEQYILTSIIKEGFTFSKIEKDEVKQRLTKLEIWKDVFEQRWQDKWNSVFEEGRLQTPKEKRELILDVLEDYMNGKNK